jgi:aldose 1-epimerase
VAGERDVTPPERDLRVVALRAPGGGLEARFAAGAGMVGCSLRHRGEELLGILGGVEPYLACGKTFGLPLLYPWANRLGGWRYEVAGRTVEIDRSTRRSSATTAPSPACRSTARCRPAFRGG